MKVEAAPLSIITTHPRTQSNNNNSILNKIYSMLSPRKHEHVNPKPAPLLTPAKNNLDRLEQLKRLFHRFDEDGDRNMSPSELQKCLRVVLGEELSLEDAEAVICSVDSDGDGLLSLDDFIYELAKAEEECEEERTRHLREAFRVYEMEGEGCITPKSLRRALGRLGQSKTVEECMAMIRPYDVNGDGVIGFDEFENMMVHCDYKEIER